ncbi:hypothetical protein [Pseudoxanthobacter sp.]|uniref:hypothetical protein n=1 Tax=Pseudoxanthobacter sp. TaxID=1925742 RepID=UPI002FE01403
MIGTLLAGLFAIEPQHIALNRDQYSLNSLNGFFSAGGEDFFFKFHQEEGEEDMSGEYYRADILAGAGLPVDLPVFKSTLPGEQILVYRRRTDPRFSDVLRALDEAPDPAMEDRAVAAEAALSRQIAAVCHRSLHAVTAGQVAAEPIHRLFWERMVDPVTRHPPGGRLARFYLGQTFAFPGVTLPWETLSRLKWRINGRLYDSTLGDLFAAAIHRLSPAALADAGGVIAHGDAHNANVWFTQHAERAELTFFDPAFAGQHVPSLLAEVKATFHNCLAHPLWLYEPALAAERFRARATVSGDTLVVETDWQPTVLRRRLLAVKATEIWRPLLADLHRRSLLPADWERVIRLALFLCPTLVMNLRADGGPNGHNPVSSLIGFSTAVMAGSPPRSGEDVMTGFFHSIDPAHAPS